MEIGDPFVTRKCLLGIKRRAERLAAERQSFAAPGRPDTPELVVSDDTGLRVTANRGDGNTAEKGS
jgi:hypothetical protein